jgi:hypothetical protein
VFNLFWDQGHLAVADRTRGAARPQLVVIHLHPGPDDVNWLMISRVIHTIIRIIVLYKC